MLDEEIRSLGRRSNDAPGDYSAHLASARSHARAGRTQEAATFYRMAMRTADTLENYQFAVRLAVEQGIEAWVGQPLPDSAEYAIGQTSPTYAEAVYNLRDSLTAVYQPYTLVKNKKTGKLEPVERMFSVEETVRVRRDVYREAIKKDPEHPEKFPERLRLFKWVSASTGVALKEGSTAFRINRICRELITINRRFNGRYLPINYASLRTEDGWSEEFESSDGIYNQRLTESQARAHQGWKVLIPDTTLREDYIGIVYAERPQPREGEKLAMGFFVPQNPEQDQLRALGLDYLDSGSGAYGDWDLYGDARSLQVVQK